jgi:hypothetical protein
MLQRKLLEYSLLSQIQYLNINSNFTTDIQILIFCFFLVLLVVFFRRVPFVVGLTTLLVKVVITSRQLLAEVSAGTLKPKSGTAIPMQLDLSDLKSVVTFSQEFEEKFKVSKYAFLTF